jgi:hypothetical protein
MFKCLLPLILLLTNACGTIDTAADKYHELQKKIPNPYAKLDSAVPVDKTHPAATMLEDLKNRVPLEFFTRKIKLEMYWADLGPTILGQCRYGIDGYFIYLDKQKWDLRERGFNGRIYNFKTVAHEVMHCLTGVGHRNSVLMEAYETYSWTSDVLTYTDVIDLFVLELDALYTLGPKIYSSYNPTIRQAVGVPVLLLMEVAGLIAGRDDVAETTEPIEHFWSTK